MTDRFIIWPLRVEHVKGCHGVSDWIVEIVSPNSKQMDYYKNVAKSSDNLREALEIAVNALKRAEENPESSNMQYSISNAQTIIAKILLVMHIGQGLPELTPVEIVGYKVDETEAHWL